MILYPLILAFSLWEKGLLRVRELPGFCLLWLRSSRDSQNQDLFESYRYVNGTLAVIHNAIVPNASNDMIGPNSLVPGLALSLLPDSVFDVAMGIAAPVAERLSCTGLPSVLEATIGFL